MATPGNDLCVSESSEESPSGPEKVQDCDSLLEPTLLGPLKGGGSSVSVSDFPCSGFPALLFF